MRIDSDHYVTTEHDTHVADATRDQSHDGPATSLGESLSREIAETPRVERDEPYARWWELSGRNGYWCADEYRSYAGQKQGRATYGSVCVGTRRECLRIVAALNAAYLAGRSDPVIGPDPDVLRDRLSGEPLSETSLSGGL